MARFRLRFLLQEFDLAGPEVILGRSPECQITIEDPLISRQHARISIETEEATITDLGSRNGVRVNGRLIKGAQSLKDGDRIRLGTQELVFGPLRSEQRAARPTGYMRVCHACGTPNPEGALKCPHCGAQASPEEDTMSGVMVEPKRNWTFQLLGEYIERTLAGGKSGDAEHVLRRAAKEVDDRLATGDRLDVAQVSMPAKFAVRLARLMGGSEWVAWALTIHRRQGLMLSEEVIDRLEELDLSSYPDVAGVLDGYLAWFRAQHGDRGPSADLARLARLEQLRRGG